MTSTREHAISECGNRGNRGVVRLRSGGGNTESDFVELPIAVGFGSPVHVRPRRLRAVPGLPVEFVGSPGLRTRGRVLALPAGQVLDLGEVPALDDPAVARSGLAVNAALRAPVRLCGPESAPLRLTARGRVVLLVVAATIGLAVVVAAWFGAGTSAPPARSAQPAEVVVHNGDTLWSIASRLAPDRDPRAVVHQLLQVNHLHTPALVPGQVLRTH